jgi:hypothetical protein
MTYGAALNKQNIIYPAGMPFSVPMQQQPEKEGVLRKLFRKKQEPANV